MIDDLPCQNQLAGMKNSLLHSWKLFKEIEKYRDDEKKMDIKKAEFIRHYQDGLIG